MKHDTCDLCANAQATVERIFNIFISEF